MRNLVNLDGAFVANSVSYGETTVFNVTASGWSSSGVPTGTVTLRLYDSPYTVICEMELSPINDSDSSGSCIYDPLVQTPGIVGETDFSIYYSGDSEYTSHGTQISNGFEITRAIATLSTINQSSDTTVMFEDFTTSISMSGSLPGHIPTGIVDVHLVNKICTIYLLDGSGSCTGHIDEPGNGTISINYSGDSYYASSSESSSEIHYTNPYIPDITFERNEPNPSNLGECYYVTAHVQGAVGKLNAPQGSLTISDGAGQSCSPFVYWDDSTCILEGTCIFASNTGGIKTITASFNSEDYDYDNASGTTTHTVNKAMPTISITSDTPDPSYTNQAYTVTVSASGSNGTPTGTVTVSDGEGASCPITLSGGSGSCNLTGSTPGARTLTAQYSGDNNYTARSTTTSHTVSSPTASINFTSNTPNPSYVNQAYTIGVSLSGPLGTPTGTVAVNDGSGASCSILLSGGTGNCSLASTTHGSKTITASYSGDANYVSSSDTAAHQVSQRTPNVTITADTLDPSYVFQTYPVSVTVNGTGETPSGTVNVNDGSGATCAITLSSGSGSCSLASTTPGSKTLTAAYGGDTIYTLGSDTEAHTVYLYDSTTSITAVSSASTLVGESYTIQVEVTSVSPVGPSGSVTISDDDGNSCSASLTNGSGSCLLTSTITGSKTLSASYPGDTRHLSSTGNKTHTVNIAPTTAHITSVSSSDVKVKEPFTVSFGVESNAPSTAIPNGDVTISDGEGNTCTGTLNASGLGSCILSASSPGLKTLSLSYPGNSNFQSSSDSDSVTVGKAATSITITDDLPDPSSSKAPYTVNVSAALVAPSVGTPETDVIIEDGTGNDCTVTLVNGLGSCTFNTETTGTITLKTDLAESTNYLASSDSESHFIATLPDDISLSENRVSTAHTDIGQLSYRNGYPTYTYTLENSGSVCNGVNGSGNSGFEISANPGNLTAILQRKTTTPKGTYPVCVMVTDALGASYQEAFSILVNETPSDLTLSDDTAAVDESQVGIFSTSDGLSPFTYALATSGGTCDAVNSSGNAQFTLVEDMLKTQPGITTGSYNICIQVNDFFNDSYQEAFTITITDASQGGTYDFSASSTSLIDGDPAGTLLGTLLTSGGANPLFALVDNGSYPDNQFFSISGNQVIFTGTANLGQKSEFVIKVMVTAPDGTQHTEEIHVRIYSDGATAGAIPGQHRYFVLTGDRLIFDPELTDIFSSFASGWSFHELVQMPSHGTAETGSIIYHSNPNFNGVENISYRICDNAGYCMLVDVNIVVESSGLPLPFSGFAPSVITKLPDQVHEYTDSKLILRIPKLSIETEIVGVPYSQEGWDVRWLDKQAGWLQGTAFPTWTGNSVVTAHLVDANGNPGLFAKLGELYYGDLIEIEYLDRVYCYEVRSSDVYDSNASQPLAHTPEGFDYLTLLTCKGYNPESGTYDGRLALQAVLINIK